MLAAAQGLPGAVSLQQAILFAQLEANEQQKASELSNRCCRGEPGSRLNTPLGLSVSGAGSRPPFTVQRLHSGRGQARTAGPEPTQARLRQAPVRRRMLE